MKVFSFFFFLSIHVQSSQLFYYNCLVSKLILKKIPPVLLRYFFFVQKKFYFSCAFIAETAKCLSVTCAHLKINDAAILCIHIYVDRVGETITNIVCLIFSARTMANQQTNVQPRLGFIVHNISEQSSVHIENCIQYTVIALWVTTRKYPYSIELFEIIFYFSTSSIWVLFI